MASFDAAGMPLNENSGPDTAGALAAQPASTPGSTLLASAARPPRSTTRRAGSLTSWMLGFAERLLSSIVSKSLLMSRSQCVSLIFPRHSYIIATARIKGDIHMIFRVFQGFAAVAAFVLLTGFGAGAPIRDVVSAPIPPNP